MRTLLWKDYRQNRKVLAAIAILVVLPYLVACVAFGADQRTNWAGTLFGAAIWSLILSTAMTAFIAGNAIAGERADRSAEFAAYLPIPRRRAVVSKAILASAACAVMFLVNLAILYATKQWIGDRYGPADTVFVIGLYATATDVLLFGVAWLLSALSNSPPLAAASAVASAIVLATVLSAIEVARNAAAGLFHESVFEWYPHLCFVVGLPSFVAGVLYYLRRVEP